MDTDQARQASSNQSEIEDAAQRFLENLMRSDLLPPGDLLRSISLFIHQKDLAHILFMEEIYRSIVNVPGYIAEFGVMWGRNLSLIMGLRECLEPYNHKRRIISFDTLSGFINTASEDHGTASTPAGLHEIGTYSVSKDYERTLKAILQVHQSGAHLSHVKRFELVKGDAQVTLSDWLRTNSEAIFAMCYLDLDLYNVTKGVLELLKPRLVRGSILIFDEVLNSTYPGETQTIMEVFGLPNMRLSRTSLSGWKTFYVLD